MPLRTRDTLSDLGDPDRASERAARAAALRDAFNAGRAAAQAQRNEFIAGRVQWWDPPNPEGEFRRYLSTVPGAPGIPSRKALRNAFYRGRMGQSFDPEEIED